MIPVETISITLPGINRSVYPTTASVTIRSFPQRNRFAMLPKTFPRNFLTFPGFFLMILLDIFFKFLSEIYPEVLPGFFLEKTTSKTPLDFFL